MLGKSPSQTQGKLFEPLLIDFINMRHPLVALAERIPWNDLERDFAKFYSNVGQPSKPVRMMVGLLILKQLYDLGDETLMPQWVCNPYFQFFCGEAHFQHRPPCDPSDLVHFRKRIGAEGVQRIFQLSVELHSDKISSSNDLLVDTTVQEKNISFPTDAKLHRKIVAKCNAIAAAENANLRQSYRRTVKKLMRAQYNGHHPRRMKQARKARKKLKTIAGRQVRDLERKLSAAGKGALERHEKELELFKQVLQQTRQSKNKVYSLHETHVACIAKGKAHKRYEFGSKVSVALVPKLNIVVGISSFQGNPYDGNTLEPTLQQVRKMTGKDFKRVMVDRGYRGAAITAPTEVIIPGEGKQLSKWQKQERRRRCRSRAAIEAVIGHLKQDYRLLRNFLKGVVGDQMNAMLAGAALNFKKWMVQQARSTVFLAFWSLLRQIVKEKRPGTVKLLLSES